MFTTQFTMSCKRKDLSQSQKLASENVSQTEISLQFGCSQSTVSKIISQKEDIKHDAAENKMKDRKRKHTGKADNVEKALYTWFVDAQAGDVPITTLVLEEKAKQFATALDTAV